MVVDEQKEIKESVQEWIKDTALWQRVLPFLL